MPGKLQGSGMLLIVTLASKANKYQIMINQWDNFIMEQLLQKCQTYLYMLRNEITEGLQWVQGDHSISIQNGCPAFAISLDWFSAHIDNQEITHTPTDTLEIVDCHKLLEIARALGMFLMDYRISDHGHTD